MDWAQYVYICMYMYVCIYGIITIKEKDATISKGNKVGSYHIWEGLKGRKGREKMMLLCFNLKSKKVSTHMHVYIMYTHIEPYLLSIYLYSIYIIYSYIYIYISTCIRSYLYLYEDSPCPKLSSDGHVYPRLILSLLWKILVNY